MDIGLEKKPEYIESKRWDDLKNLKQDADKKRSLASGYLLWSMCRRLEIKSPVYRYSQKGKPYPEGMGNLAFNISHSGDYAVLAFHKSTEPIGVDIQQIRPLHAGVEKRILHEKENMPENISQEERTRYLNRIWAIKESYVKMTGEGLSCDFRKLQVDFENGLIQEDGKDTAYFIEVNQKEGYALAVCTMNPEDIQIEEI